jgi:ribosomal protein L11 methyltransferase
LRRVSAGVRHIHARVRGAAAASAVFALLDDIAAAVSAFETRPGDWRLEAYPQSPVLTPNLSARLALAAAAGGGELVEIGEEKLPNRDWLTENQLAFPPLRIGRFFVYGSHHRGGVPAGAIGVALDAATAFGTGEHPSTRGCLLALQTLAQKRRIARPLDIGAGTGILSIAAAKLLRRKVSAGDIDPGSVAVARHNIARNSVAGLVRVGQFPGYRGRAIRRRHYDLILSNILARPLALLAADLARHLAPGGRAVLSGLLRRQEPIVLAPHHRLGIALERRIVIAGWSTLILRVGTAPKMPAPKMPAPKMAMGAKAPIYRSGSGQRPVRPPSAARRPPPSAKGQAPSGDPAGNRPRPGRGSASGEPRYRRASGHREPSTRHKPAPGAAKPKMPYRLKRRG